MARKSNLDAHILRPDFHGEPKPRKSKEDNSTVSPEEYIYGRIWSAITARSLVPGMRLKEEELAEIFGVNRPIVRQALSRLAHDSLVTLQHNRGCYVAKPTVKEARDIYSTRRLIEDQLIRRLIEQATKNDIKLLRDHLAAERKAHKNRNYENMVRYSAEFHLLIAELADVPVMKHFLRQLMAQSSLIKAMYQRWVHVERGASDHAALVELIAKRDVDEATRVLNDHLLELETELDLDNPMGVEFDLKAIFGEKPV